MKQTRTHKSPVGRPKTFDKEAVVRLAMLHFWEYGYDKTNLEALLKAMGIKKSSFYNTFRSKEEVFSLALELYRKESFAWLKALSREHGVKAALMTMVRSSIDELRAEGTLKGCLLFNSANACYARYSELSTQITVEYHALQAYIGELIAEGQKKNEISQKTDATTLAIRFLCLYSGIIMILQAGGKGDEIDDLIEMTATVLA